MGPAAMAFLQGGINASNSGLGNLWAAKERRIQHHNAYNMLGDEQAYNINQNNLAYERSLDYKAQVEALKEAGINPYAIAGNPMNAPSANSAHQNAPAQAPYTSMDPINLAQIGLIQAQKANIDADTANKQAENPYIAPKNQANIDNLQASIQHTQSLVTTEQGKQALMELQGIAQGIENQYNAKMKESTLLSQEQERAKSIQDVKRSQAEIKFLQVQQDKMKAEIDKIANDIKTGIITQAEGAMRIYTMLKKLPEEIKAIQRSNQGVLTPLKSLQQESKPDSLGPGQRFRNWQKQQENKRNQWRND